MGRKRQQEPETVPFDNPCPISQKNNTYFQQCLLGTTQKTRGANWNQKWFLGVNAIEEPFLVLQRTLYPEVLQRGATQKLFF